MNFAFGIRKARERVGLSQRKLAEMAGFNASYVNHLETGKRQPSLEALEAFAAAMRMPVSLLFLSCASDKDLSGITAKKSRELFGLLLKAIETGE